MERCTYPFSLAYSHSHLCARYASPRGVHIHLLQDEISSQNISRFGQITAQKILFYLLSNVPAPPKHLSFGNCLIHRYALTTDVSSQHLNLFTEIFLTLGLDISALTYLRMLATFLCSPSLAFLPFYEAKICAYHVDHLIAIHTTILHKGEMHHNTKLLRTLQHWYDRIAENAEYGPLLHQRICEEQRSHRNVYAGISAYTLFAKVNRKRKSA